MNYMRKQDQKKPKIVQKRKKCKKNKKNAKKVLTLRIDNVILLVHRGKELKIKANLDANDL